MKKLALIIALVTLIPAVYAQNSTDDAQRLNALASAWKIQPATDAQRAQLRGQLGLTTLYTGRDFNTRFAAPVLALT